MKALWWQVTYSPIALWIAIGDFAIAALFLVIDDKIIVYVALVVSIPGWVAILRIFFATYKAQIRRGRMRHLLQAALAAHGEVRADVGAEDFPDIPVCLSRKWIYCAREKDVDVQPLDQMIWAYGESFIQRPWAQLAIWNRTASANVLPLRKRDMAMALGRIRQTASWLPVGYNNAMKETWNADHREFLALVDEYRQSSRPFDAPWAGQGPARVAAQLGSSSIQDFADMEETREFARLTQRWNQEAADTKAGRPS
jgi:hypothetical protein